MERATQGKKKIAGHLTENDTKGRPGKVGGGFVAVVLTWQKNPPPPPHKQEGKQRKKKTKTTPTPQKIEDRNFWLHLRGRESGKQAGPSQEGKTMPERI